MDRFRTAWRTIARCVALSLCLMVLGPGRHTSAQPATQSTHAMAKLPASTPLAFLEKCLARYDAQHIQGYRLIMEKQERIQGQLQPPEIIKVAFRAEPYSARMHWLRGAREVDAVLYVAGQNQGLMLVHMTGFAGELMPVLPLDPESKHARQETLFSIKDFGLRNTLLRTLTGWQKAQGEGTLYVEYLGIHNVAAAGNRPCYHLLQTQAPDARGVATVSIYIDQETWFQVGTILKGAKGELIGKYFYRDIQLNPVFRPQSFQASALGS